MKFNRLDMWRQRFFRHRFDCNVQSANIYTRQIILTAASLCLENTTRRHLYLDIWISGCTKERCFMRNLPVIVKLSAKRLSQHSLIDWHEFHLSSGVFWSLFTGELECRRLATICSLTGPKYFHGINTVIIMNDSDKWWGHWLGPDMLVLKPGPQWSQH